MKKISSFVLALAMGVTPNLTLAQDFDAFEFRNVGPTRAGRVTAVAGTVVAPSTFYLGASGGGVWKTEDYGTSWFNVSDGYFNTPSIGDIAVSQNDPNIIYVGTGSDGLRSNVITGKGVYKSIDGGKTWSHIGLPNVGQIGAVEIDPTDNNIVYVAAIGHAFNSNKDRGLYKTIDGGETWENILFLSEEIGITDVEILPHNPNVIFASAWKAERKPWTILSGGPADEGGIYKSQDGGKNWIKLENGLPTGLVGKIDLATSADDSSVVVALVEAPDPDGGLYRSEDQGKTFKHLSDDDGIRNRPFYYTNVDMDPKNADNVFVLANRFFKSQNGGKTWDLIPPPHGDNHDMWMNTDNPDLFIFGDDGGASITHNGGKTWSTQFNQPTAELYQVEVDDQYPYWLYAGQQDNYTTIAVPSMQPYDVQHTNRWVVNTGGCETGPAVPKPGNHNIVYSNCKGRFGVYDKRLGTEKAYYVGATNMYGQNPKDLKYRFQRVSPVHVSPHDGDTVYHTSQYVHRTRDDGVTWETISPDLTANEPDKQVLSGSPITRDITGEEVYSTIYAIQESKIQKGVIWTGSNDGVISVTQNDGESWENVTPRRLPKGGRVDGVEPSPHNPAKAYASILRYQLGDWKPYIYKTENFGKSWTLLTNGKNGIPADYPTRVVREDPGREGVLYAGTEFGLFISMDDGDTWKSFQQNLPVTPVTDIKVYREDLVLSTMGRGFWILDNVTTLHQDGFETVGSEPVLFKPKDTIRYRSPRGRYRGKSPNLPAPSLILDYYIPEGNKSPVHLEIYNDDGTLVTGYVNGMTEEHHKSETVHDMNTSTVMHYENKSLGMDAGMNRFHWDMSYKGPWHTNKARRFGGGIIAAPGDYKAVLKVGDTVSEQSFTLNINPTILMGGTTLAEIEAQEELGLKMTNLLSKARMMESHLVKAQKELAKLEKAGDLSAEETSRLSQVNAALELLKTKDQIYPTPMLSDQISYLYNMTNGADQSPGKDTLGRFDELSEKLEAISATLKE